MSWSLRCRIRQPCRPRLHRRQIGDRASYVLGWSNEAKIAALAKQERDLSTRITEHTRQIIELKGEAAEWGRVLGLWQQLAVFASFSDLDWTPLVAMIDRFKREQQDLAPSSDLRRTLQQQLRNLGEVQAGIDAQHAQANASLATLVEKLSQARSLLAESGALAGAIDDAMRATTLPALEALRGQASGEYTLTVESCDNRERDMRDMREFVQARIDADSKRIATLRDRIISAMQDYATAWPLDTREVDVSIEAAPEFRRMLQDRCAQLGRVFGIECLAQVDWLRSRRVIYWGDIDTHGFAILDRLRASIPGVESLLMDEETLQAHRHVWGHEDGDKRYLADLIRLTEQV